MGLIYSSADSAQLISALRRNIQSAKETTSQLTAGSQRIVSAVDGRTLAGAAYTAGKGLFSELIIPTISRVTNAFSQLEQEVQTFQSADNAIKSEGSYLDEDILKRKIEIKRAQKSSALTAVSTLTSQIKLANTPEMSAYVRSTQREMNRLADSLEEDIRKLQKKLEALHTFSSSTNGLFSHSLNDLKIAMQGVTVLSKTVVMNNGNYVLPKGTDQSWFTDKKSGNYNNLTEQQKIDLANELEGVPKDKQEETLLKWFEKNVFPISNDVALALLEEHRDELSKLLFSASTKTLGTSVSGALYSGSKVIGNATTAMPIIGSVIDYGSQIADGENSTDALLKTGAHALAGVGIGAAVTLVGLTGGIGIAAAVGAGFMVDVGIDYVYDKLKKPVGKAIKSIGSWIGTLWK